MSICSFFPPRCVPPPFLLYPRVSRIFRPFRHGLLRVRANNVSIMTTRNHHYVSLSFAFAPSRMLLAAHSLVSQSHALISLRGIVTRQLRHRDDNATVNGDGKPALLASSVPLQKRVIGLRRRRRRWRRWWRYLLRRAVDRVI